MILVQCRKHPKSTHALSTFFHEKDKVFLGHCTGGWAWHWTLLGKRIIITSQRSNPSSQAWDYQGIGIYGEFYRGKTLKDKVIIVDKYANEKLDMSAEIKIQDHDRKYFLDHTASPLLQKFCQVVDMERDSRLLCKDCMCHYWNTFFLWDKKKNQAMYLCCWLSK